MRRVRFDVFEADLRSGELWKQGVRLKLGEQPFSVLALLLAQPGELISRDELQKKLWPGQTFVDFDRGLNKAINRLREGLGDSAEAPRFIETLPKRGYRFIGTVIEAAPTATADATSPRGRRWLPWTGGALALFALLITVWWLPRAGNQPDEPSPLIRSSVLPPPGHSFVTHSLALSADGSYFAFVAENGEGKRNLWIRAMSATTATPIADTDGAMFPFWSPDRRELAFFADRKLKVVDVTGGVVRDIADARLPSGGTWNRDGVIVFAPDVNGPLYRVSARGDAPQPASQVEQAEVIRGHRWPVFLPDEEHFVFVSFGVESTSDNSPELRLGSVKNLESTRIPWDGARSAIVTLDHLLYVHRGQLFAQPFDASTRETSGKAVPIANIESSAAPAFFPSPITVSRNGVLLFQSAADMPANLGWLDAEGREKSLTTLRYAAPSLSPDGKKLAGSCEGTKAGTLAICVFDLARNVSSRITDGPYDRYPVWSRDGRQLAYTNGEGIHRVLADGSGPTQFVSPRGIPTGWTTEGRVLSFGSLKGVVSLAVSSPESHEVQELGPGAEGQLSPDGVWLAYLAPAGLVIERFPRTAERLAVAASGVAQPRWSRDGQRLFYVSADKKLVAVNFDPANFSIGASQVLSQTRIVGPALVGFQYDVAPDGQFIVNMLTGEAAPLTLMSGWTSLLR